MVCYELTPTELKTTHICPHCHYNLGDQVPNVAGQLDDLDIRIDDLLDKLTKLPPLDEVAFKQKLNELIAGYTKGKDEGKLRIIVK